MPSFGARSLAAALLLLPTLALAEPPALVVSAAGVFVRAASLGDQVRIAGPGGRLVRGSVQVPFTAGEVARVGECGVAAEIIDGTLYIERAGLECLGFDLPYEIPSLAMPKLEPVLDWGLQPARGAVRIVIDAGHGGRDAGARRGEDLLEKDITLNIAREVADLLEGREGFEIYRTRTDDRYLSLRDRAEFANRLNADFFVSIHCNSGRRLGARGVEIFIPARHAEDDETRQLVAAENGDEDDGFILHDPNDILGELALADQLQHSARAARALLASLVGTLETEDRGVKRAPFWVLLGSNMPAVLIETGFVTNPEEGALLADAAYQRRAAEAIVEALLGLQPSLLARRITEDHATISQARGQSAAPPETHSELAP